MYKKFIKTKYMLFFCFCLLFLLSSIFSSSYAVKISDGKEGFFETGDMIYARKWHSSVLLPDGRVFISGGYGFRAHVDHPGSSIELATTEIYDPKTKKFIEGPPLEYARAKHSSVLLDNGKVLIAGGTRTCYPGYTEIYDPKTNTITTGPKLTTYSSNCGFGFNIVKIDEDNYILENGLPILNGFTGFNKYNEKTNTISEIKVDDFYKIKIGNHIKFFKIDNNEILLIYHDGHVVVTDKNFSKILRQSSPKCYHPNINGSYIMLDNKNILEIGGDQKAGYIAEIYDVKKNKFIPVKTNRAEHIHPVKVLKKIDGNIIVFNGHFYVHPLAEEFLVNKHILKQKTYHLPTPFELGSFVLLKDGSFLYTGGEDRCDKYKRNISNQAYIYKFE